LQQHRSEQEAAAADALATVQSTVNAASTN
jgi:hypothetical protein